MARQKGVIKLEGRVGDLSFYKSGNEYLAREKGGVDGDRIKKDPAYARTRENGAEFGRAGKAGKELRNALNEVLVRSADKRVSNRLASAILKAIQADTTNRRGERNVLDGDLTLLKGFEFNNVASLESVLKLSYTVAFDRAAGGSQLAIEAFNPSKEIPKVEGATHVRFILATAAVDFNNQSYEVDVQEGADVEITALEQNALNVDCAISADSPHPVFIVVGVEYYQEVNGHMYALQTKTYNPMAIVEVSKV
ncbi:hypothetical protein [Carboxylicivirga sp. M1479]|uniref:hypothetical protein n=1 Tax=Carboxylicivirga sp. M1479 TaxID=2594476 RepID=UPI0011775789|nr:hypothetical protein [Carboxylicivirga sp. M1479]TRX72577.1 hypothetical protein FNN09_01165 [Carboxylicivirga sp. M1479]